MTDPGEVLQVSGEDQGCQPRRSQDDAGTGRCRGGHRPAAPCQGGGPVKRSSEMSGGRLTGEKHEFGSTVSAANCLAEHSQGGAGSHRKLQQ